MNSTKATQTKRLWQGFTIFLVVFGLLFSSAGIGSSKNVVSAGNLLSSGQEGHELDPSGVTPLTIAGHLTQFKKLTLDGGYVAAGAGMRNLGKGTISIKGIPDGSTILAAYLYWNIISETDTLANKKGKINGNAIQGALIGTTGSPCWGNGSSRSYRADVTKWVSANNRNYSLTGFASGVKSGTNPGGGDAAPLLEGASLVIIFRNNEYPNTTIFLYDGAVNNSASIGYAETTIKSIPWYQSYLAYTTFIIADGQSYSDGGGYFNGRKLPSADFDGTDPVSIPGDYSYGNLWDTEDASSVNTAKRSISVGKYIKPVSSSVKVRVDGQYDCLVHVAQVLSVSNGNSDTDGDGLRDGWEANGYETVNLPALGANPFHKDLFLEIDWMADVAGETSHKPSQEVIDGLVASFKAGDVVNPDNIPGVALHVDVSNSIPHTNWFTTWIGCLNLWPKLESTKKANMAADRYKTHHYQLWVHDICSNTIDKGTSGIAQDIPGDDSIVSLGSWTNQGSKEERIGTSMHEFGHTLGLRHGFPTGVTPTGNGGADDAFTPNHLSIMSYIYQTSGLIKNGQYYTFDFQRWDLPALNEKCLDETAGVGNLSALNNYGLKWLTGTEWPGVAHEDLTNGAANGPVDWNGNGGDPQTCASFSINLDSDKETLKATKGEWKLLVYNGGAVGVGAEYGLDEDGNPIPVYHVDPASFHELTFDEDRMIHNK